MNKDYSVIPINWLLETDIDNVSSSSVKYCYWPPFRVTSIHLKEATDPDPSWQQYQIKVVGGNKTYGNFNKAWYKRVEVESTDTENVLNDPFLSKKKNIFDSSDSDNEGSSMLGTFPKESLQTSSTVNSASVSSAVAFTSYKENSYTNLEPLTLFDSNSIASMIQDSDYMHSFLSKTSESSNSVSQVPTQNEESMASQNQPFPNTIENSSEGGIHILFKQIYEELIANRMMNKRLCNKIDSLKDDVKKFTSQMVPTLGFSNDTEDMSFISQFPLSSKEITVECEKVLQIDCNIKKKLENMFCSIGGNDGKTHLRRILSKAFNNKFAIDCSWTGRAFEKDITKFKIKDLLIINLMKVLLTVRKRIKDIGTISQRQFQRRIENKILQLLHNNPAITKHSNIQSSSQVTNSNTIKSVFR
ncbi:uncharacterized protein LOC111027787 isoform X3 [Myzus persicae]|uniref:uncharacterized protein LOC111027787 isoform X3 n=1 Tax=Myzus persicae TaxID=13164 RepID=UPI000B931703|nr:uncharacterized protein LOC111027787 isoform X3 [Myzus persicae]